MRLQSARELRDNLEKLLFEKKYSGTDGHPYVRVIRRWSDTLSGHGSIFDGLAIGITPARRGEYMIAIRVAKAADRHHELVRVVSSIARGEVDIRVTGLISAQATSKPDTRLRHRPLRAGASIGHYRTPAGTLGFFASKGSAIGIVSNNHVLADCNRAVVGDPVLQPGTTDGGTHPDDVAANLADFVRLQVAGRNTADAAFAVLLDAQNCVSFDILGVGAIQGITNDVVANIPVMKTGRASGYTRGRISAFEVTPVVRYLGIPPMRFFGQIEVEGVGVESFSSGGDSGALVLDTRHHAIALLFASSQRGGANNRGLTYATPIKSVIDALEIELLQ